MSRGFSYALSITAGAFVVIAAGVASAQTPAGCCAREDMPVSEAPRAIAAADLTGDGWIDLVVAGTAPARVTVLTSAGADGGGGGARYQARDYDVSGGPFDLALADLNRDGWIDIAVANADANAITLLFNAGHGDFAAPVDIPLPGNPRGIAIGDLDRDGRPDLVATEFMGSTVDVLYGAGDGTFARRAALPAPARSQGIAIADVDHNGWPDIAVAAESGTIRLFRMSAGGVTTSDLSPGGAGWNVIAASDLDADGRPDLAVASTASSIVQVLYNRSSGWVAATPVPVAGSPRGIAIADLNRDGRAEIVTAGRAESTVTVIMRASNGTLSTWGAAAGSGARSIVLADLNNSGGPEAATANEFGRGVTILSSQGAFPPAGFAFDHTLLPWLYDDSVFGTADFNHNGTLDIVRANSVFFDGTTQSRNLGANALRNVTPSGGVGDFNGDGNPDVVFTDFNQFQVFFGTGGTDFTDGPITNEPNTGDLRVEDMNRDGRLDILVSQSGYQVAAGIDVFLGGGDGTFTKAGRIDGTFNAFEVGDVDRDGIPDVVTTSNDGVAVFRGNGTGGFGTAMVTDPGVPRFALALGDLNRDGMLDAVAVDAHTYDWGGITAWSTFTILRGNGNGTFTPGEQYETIAQDAGDFHVLYNLVIGDLTGDGQPDILTSDGELYPGTGSDAPLLDPVRFDIFSLRRGVLADVNHDGLLDVLGYTGRVAEGPEPMIIYNTLRGPSENRAPVGLSVPSHVVWPYDRSWWDTDENYVDSGVVTDPDLHKVRFHWTLPDGTIVGEDPGFAPRLFPGSYQVTVTADDRHGGSMSASLTLDVPPFQEMVLTPGWDARVYGAWQAVDDPSAVDGRRVWHPDAGAPKLTTPLANPANFFELQFLADPTQEYKLWVRLKADGDSWANDSVFVQFTGAKDGAGNPIYEIGTTSALAVNLEECSGCGVSGWGWEDDGWGGVNVNGTTLRFPDGGPQTIRVQTREDGVSIDQIVLSAVKYRSTRPGAAKNDTTILPRTGPYLTPPER
jgi:hypothetical protein